MTRSPTSFAWLPVVSTLLSWIACYGTLVIIAALGALGIVVAISDAVWAGVIVGFASIAVLGLAVSVRCHRKYWPLTLGLAGFALVIYAFYVDYHRMTEFAGLVLLAAAAFWDLQLRRRNS